MVRGRDSLFNGERKREKECWQSTLWKQTWAPPLELILSFLPSFLSIIFSLPQTNSFSPFLDLFFCKDRSWQIFIMKQKETEWEREWERERGKKWEVVHHSILCSNRGKRTEDWFLGNISNQNLFWQFDSFLMGKILVREESERGERIERERENWERGRRKKGFRSILNVLHVLKNMTKFMSNILSFLSLLSLKL